MAEQSVTDIRFQVLDKACAWIRFADIGAVSRPTSWITYGVAIAIYPANQIIYLPGAPRPGEPDNRGSRPFDQHHPLIVSVQAASGGETDTELMSELHIPPVFGNPEYIRKQSHYIEIQLLQAETPNLHRTVRARRPLITVGV